MDNKIQKRKTFAIISHPDAGKTTLTEKFLLFGGAIQVAGAVKSNKIKKTTTSDFMEIERQRGISVATSVMNFEYQDVKIYLLDTPGHKDFAEDTYRTLSAVDSAIVVVDSVKGVESQTERLMEVCRMRKTPIIVFINKLDRDGKDPFDLLDDIEKTLKINVCPMTWPINCGRDFKGVYDLFNKNLILFGNQADNTIIKAEHDFENINKILEKRDSKKLVEDLEVLDIYPKFDEKEYHNATTAPVFFGSAVNTFGVKEVLDIFINIAPQPKPKETTQGIISPENPKFSGFIFKIHANIDPRHRDRIAFLRICSGVFERSKNYFHVRLEKSMRFNNPYTFFGREKNVIEYAYPGEVIGLFDTGNFKIGDTLTEGEKFYYTGIPTFSPEIFKELVNKDPMKTKQLEKGVKQLTDEGVAQLFTQHGGNKKIIGCVGELQFEVIKYRLKEEYGALCEFNTLPFHKACWLKSENRQKILDFSKYKQEYIALDKDNNIVYLSPSEWYLNTEKANNKEITFAETNEVSGW